MAPTKFDDFGKKAKDLFKDHHEAGQMKFTNKGKIGDASKYKLEFKNPVGGNDVDWKATCETKGMKITFDHKNTLSKEIEIGIPNMKELNFKWTPTFNAASGLNLGKLKTSFANDMVNVNVTTPVCASPMFDVDVSMSKSGKCPGLLGLKGQVDVKGMGFSKGQFGFQCANDDYECSFLSDSLTGFGGTYSFYKNLPDNKTFCCYGLQTTSSGAINVAAATKCCGDNYRFKLNQTGEFSVAKVSKLNGQATLNLSAAINLADMSSGGHRFGMGFTFE